MENVEIKGVLDGKEVTLIVKGPSHQNHIEAKLFSNKMAAKLLSERDENNKPVIVLRSQIEQLRKDLKIWDDKKQAELDKIDNDIVTNLRKLSNGGRMTKKQAVDIAFKVQELRQKKFELLIESRKLDEISFESQCENNLFDTLVSLCVFDEEGNRVFTSVEDYRSRNDSEIIVKCASKLASILYDFKEDAEKLLPENQFLIKHQYLNDDLHFIKEGKLVSKDGLLVSESGRYVNESGEFVDRDGNLVTEAGELIGNETVLVDSEDELVTVEDKTE